MVCVKGVSTDGIPYEEELCADSQPRGVLLFGDSAGAHFHIPYQWLYAPLLNEVGLSTMLIYCRKYLGC